MLRTLWCWLYSKRNLSAEEVYLRSALLELHAVEEVMQAIAAGEVILACLGDEGYINSKILQLTQGACRRSVEFYNGSEGHRWLLFGTRRDAPLRHIDAAYARTTIKAFLYTLQDAYIHEPENTPDDLPDASEEDTEVVAIEGGVLRQVGRRITVRKATSKY